ncbi:MAG TPA: type II toxin-antitoxin system RelE/ParE family toxin [Thermoguttaceae bacterium]|nr:type II toxin-antitoxin system RelE/ParE family toxin [Thermoguttaceae bacterium]
MIHQVFLTDRAHRDLLEACTWWAENRSAEQAERWYDGFAKAILSLATAPERCPLAPENQVLPYEIRQLNSGLVRRPTHRAIFTIRPNMVLILRVRHLAQKPLSPEDV